MTALLVVVAIAAYVVVGVIVANRVGLLEELDRDQQDEAAILGLIALFWPILGVLVLLAVVGRLLTRSLR